MVEINLPHNKPLYVGACYRSQQQTPIQFVEYLDDVINGIPTTSEVYILGDINLCSIRNDYSYTKYEDMLRSHGLKQIISTPTRTTETTESAIDHIITNSYASQISQSGVIINGLSDHFITYCTRKKIKEVLPKKHHQVKIRSRKNYSKDNFTALLSEADWSKVHTAADVDGAWTEFSNIFMNALDTVAPVRVVRIKQKSDPWITPDILQDIEERDKWLPKANKHPYNPENRQKFCSLRNKIQRDCRKAKEEFIVKKIEDNKSNPKKIWEQIKELGYETKTKTEENMALNINGKTCFDSCTIANHLNDFFSSLMHLT